MYFAGKVAFKPVVVRTAMRARPSILYLLASYTIAARYTTIVVRPCRILDTHLPHHGSTTTYVGVVARKS